jgi:hypothetical protein
MAWELLPVNYTDAVWSGLKRYESINNSDGTVSFRDVTVYSHKDTSFFGAKDANRMNEAMNAIMSALENGTDLYTAFQNYFALQEELFEDTADETQTGFETYVKNLKEEGDKIIDTLKTDYRNEIDAFEANQEDFFEVWFEHVRDQLSNDAAGNLQNQVDDLDLKRKGFENKIINFSTDGKRVVERFGKVLDRIETKFMDDGTIVQELYIDGVLIKTKTITFLADGTIKEDIE